MALGLGCGDAFWVWAVVVGPGGAFLGSVWERGAPLHVPVVTFIGPFEISDAVSAVDEI